MRTVDTKYTLNKNTHKKTKTMKAKQNWTQTNEGGEKQYPKMCINAITF